MKVFDHGSSRFLVAALCLALPAVAAAEEPADSDSTHHLYLEFDPLPFALGGYGIQPGIRLRQFPELRIGVGIFALEVPDAISELGGNDGFHTRVRRSHALYILYYPRPGRGLCAGGSLRYLRLRYTHDDVQNEAAVLGEVSMEAILGYKWHPFSAGFYVQPWVAMAVPIGSHGDPRSVGGIDYAPLPAQFFATANIGWEISL